MPLTGGNLSKFASALGLVFLTLSSPSALAASLVGKATQINTPSGANYRASSLQIAADPTGKFAALWSEDTEPDQNLATNDLTNFRAFDANAKPLGPAKSVVGTSAEDPHSIGIQYTGANKYTAFWYDQNEDGRLSIFRQDFNGKSSVGNTKTVFTDSNAAPVSSVSMSRMSDGRSLLIRRCECFPVTVTGQFVSKSAALVPGELTLSLSDPNYLALNFRAVAGGGFVGSYLNNEDLSGQIFSAAGKPVGSLKLLPIKTDKSLIETNTMFGLSGGGILSLYGSTAPSNTLDIYARVSKANLTGTTSYTKLIPKALGLASIALKSGDFVIAYTTANAAGDTLTVARYSPSKALVGKPVKIVGDSFSIRSLVELSNGNVVVAYSDADAKVFVQLVKP